MHPCTTLQLYPAVRAVVRDADDKTGLILNATAGIRNMPGSFYSSDMCSYINFDLFVMNFKTAKDHNT